MQQTIGGQLVKIHFQRSAAFCRKTAAETGQTVPPHDFVEFHPSALTTEAREKLQSIVRVPGTWPELEYIGYYTDYKPAWGSTSFGAKCVECDQVQPAPEQISAAILDVFNWIAAKRQRVEATAAAEAAKEARIAQLQEEISQRQAELAELTTH